MPNSKWQFYVRLAEECAGRGRRWAMSTDLYETGRPAWAAPGRLAHLIDELEDFVGRTPRAGSCLWRA